MADRKRGALIGTDPVSGAAILQEFGNSRQLYYVHPAAARRAGIRIMKHGSAARVLYSFSVATAPCGTVCAFDLCEIGVKATA